MLENMADILQISFSNAFSWNKWFYSWINILLKFVTTVRIDNKAAFVQVLNNMQLITVRRQYDTITSWQ